MYLTVKEAVNPISPVISTHHSNLDCMRAGDCWVLGGGGCGERRLEGGWWDHWTHKLTAAWLVCPKTRKGESWEETTWGENTSQTLTSTDISSNEWELDGFGLWGKLHPQGTAADNGGNSML